MTSEHEAGDGDELDDADRSANAAERVPDSGPPTSRAVAMFAIVIAGFAIVAAAAWFVGGSGGDQSRFCTAEGLVDPATGEIVGRDPTQDCRFVDENGVPIPGQ